jgi:endonuclease YncB( thermonuclease family)
MTRSRALLAAPILALVAGLLAMLGAAPAQASDRDCGDFPSQRAAQIFFLSNGGPGADPHALDAEGDGIACESNPCPCLYERSLGGDEPSSPPSGGDDGAKQVKQAARVVRVIDGDTIEVRFATGRTSDVRLIGIDTPEVYGGTECGGPEASASLKRILPVNTRVTLLSDISQDLADRYGRLLRYVHKADTGKDVNRQQVYQGFASVYVYDHNPFNRTASYRKASQLARSAQRGMWAAC